MRRARRVITRVTLGCFFGIAALIAVGNILPKQETTYRQPDVYATVDDVYAALSRQMGGATPDFETQVKPTLDLHMTYAELQRFVDEGKHADLPTAGPTTSVTQPPQTTAPFVPTPPPFVPTAPPVVLPMVSVTRVAYGPCTTPAKGFLTGWSNCPGKVYLQINRTVPSGDVRVGFDWPSLGSFFHGTAHVGTSTGPVAVDMVNTYINSCVTPYTSTVEVYDGAFTGPLIARQQVTLTTACQ